MIFTEPTDTNVLSGGKQGNCTATQFVRSTLDACPLPHRVGSPTRARTWDLRINSPSLYQLSYRGPVRRGAILLFLRCRGNQITLAVEST